MALDILRAVQIPDPERRMTAFPHEMSGGMAQRIVIAIALICSPKFIVSDDATSGLDVTVQAQILELLRRLAQDRGSSMLFITRDIGITAHFCDRVAVIFSGEIMELAGREDFFFRPAHPYTIMLMAAFSYNRAASPHVGSSRTAARRGCGWKRMSLCLALPTCAATMPRRSSAVARTCARPLCPLSFPGASMIRFCRLPISLSSLPFRDRVMLSRP